MSMNAAHRAILSGRHSDLLKSSRGDSRVLYDPDYYVMKAKCIREMNAKVRDPKRALSNEAFDTLITLLTGTVGDPFHLSEYRSGKGQHPVDIGV